MGAAYVVGAKAGRGRYDEIVAWWDRMRGRATEMQDDMQRTVTAKASDVTDVWVDGKRLLAARRPTTLNEKPVLEKARDWRRRVAASLASPK